MTGKSLKEQNRRKVASWAALLLFLFVYVVILGMPDANGLKQLLEQWKDWFGLVAGATGMAMVVWMLDGLIPRALKEVLVHWRLHDRAPGHRAFSVYALTDSRFQPEQLKGKLGDFPATPADQNTIWYQLSKKHGDNPRVFDAHKSYLASREMTSITVVMGLPLAALGFLVANSTVLAWIFLGAVVAVYLLMSFTAHRFAIEFVKNVLALEASAD